MNAPGAGYYRLFNYGTLTSGAVFSAVTGVTDGAVRVLTNIDGEVNLLVIRNGQVAQFWDGTDMAGNGIVNGGSGTWNGTNTNWTGAPGEAAINDAWETSVGVFAGAAGGTVTVEGSLGFDELQFVTDGYVLQAGTAGQLALVSSSGAGTLNVTGGVSMAGGGTNFSVTSSGSGRSDLFQVGGFVRHTIGSTYISAAAAYGWQDITTDRMVTVAGFDQLRAKFNASSYSGRVEAGNRFVLPWIGGLGLTPYGAVQVTAFDLPSYAESVVAGAGTFALSYSGKTITATRTELGFRSDKSFALNDAILTLRGRAAWAHDFNTDRSANATFQALPGASFVVNGAALARNAALTTASAELKWMNGWSIAGTFEGEFSDVTKSYAGKGVVRYAW